MKVLKFLEVKEQVPEEVLIPLLLRAFGCEPDEEINVERQLLRAGGTGVIVETIFDMLYIEGAPNCINHGFKQVKNQVK